MPPPNARHERFLTYPKINGTFDVYFCSTGAGAMKNPAVSVGAANSYRRARRDDEQSAPTPWAQRAQTAAGVSRSDTRARRGCVLDVLEADLKVVLARHTSKVPWLRPG
jgi:hypothetical protein